MNELGKKIYTLRKSKKLTLEQLAIQSGCSKSYVWELENKAPPRPSAEKLSALAKTLGVTLDYFIDPDMTEEDAQDAKFYRQYRQMPAETKDRIRKTIALWDDE